MQNRMATAGTFHCVGGGRRGEGEENRYVNGKVILTNFTGANGPQYSGTVPEMLCPLVPKGVLICPQS